jgi:S13-like H2TH domain
MSATSNPLDRSLDQRMAALAIANNSRSKRAKLKRDLQAGRASFMGLVEAPPPDWLATAKVIDMLMCVRNIGPTKAGTIMHRAGVSPRKTMGGLSPRQRSALMDAMWRRGR